MAATIQKIDAEFEVIGNGTPVLRLTLSVTDTDDLTHELVFAGTALRELVDLAQGIQERWSALLSDLRDV